MEQGRTKKPETVDLSEYAEERVPFDDVLRQIGKVKVSVKPKAAKVSKKRKSS